MKDTTIGPKPCSELLATKTLSASSAQKGNLLSSPALFSGGQRGGGNREDASVSLSRVGTRAATLIGVGRSLLLLLKMWGDSGKPRFAPQ